MENPAAGEADAVLATFEEVGCMLVLLEGAELRVRAQNAAARDRFGAHVGALLTDALGGPDGEDVIAMCREVYESGVPTVAQDWSVAAVDGSGANARIVLSITLTPCHWPDGSMRGVVAHALEVSTPVVVTHAASPQHPRRLDDRNRDARPDLAPGPDQRQVLLTALQDSFLPEGLPVAPGVHLGARYLVATDGRSGGDWFDAIALDDGRIVCVVGDVVGHGVRASVTMGQLSVLFAELVRADGDVSAALQALDSRAVRQESARSTTLCVAVLDPATGELSYCTAGHPPPLLAGADGQVTFLPPTGAGPLASGRPYTTRRHVLGAGEMLLLYSDGLVERPGRTVSQSTMDLARAVTEAVAAPPAPAVEGRLAEIDPERVCRLVIEHLTRETGFADDITVLALQRTTRPARLDLALHRSPDALRTLRTELAGWLSSVCADPLDQMAVQHAVGELVSNSLEHGYTRDVAPDDATVQVVGRLRPGGRLEVVVADQGRWRSPGSSPGRGRGLAMASGLSDEFEITHGEQGTRAVTRQRLTRSVEMLRARGAAVRANRGELEITDHGGRLVLQGPLDQRSADRLRSHLAQATRGGTRRTVVDLSGVTHLGSAGVQVLYEEIAPPGAQPGPVHLVAPMGSPAQHVLDMVGLPHLHEAPEPV